MNTQHTTLVNMTVVDDLYIYLITYELHFRRTIYEICAFKEKHRFCTVVDNTQPQIFMKKSPGCITIHTLNYFRRQITFNKRNDHWIIILLWSKRTYFAVKI